MYPEKIGNFNLYINEPNTICDGSLYIYDTKIKTIIAQKERTIRVYLPSDYDFSNPNKRFPVMYMMDGANLVDQYTSYAGEWNVDETIQKRVIEGRKSFIVVGIDCPKNSYQRSREMLPPNNFSLTRVKALGKPGADVFGEWIINDLRTLINSNFYTLTDKENTAVGGSSMGGLMAYYLGTKYKEIIGFSLCFSPAFMLFKRKEFSEKLAKFHPDSRQFGKFSFYVGGQGFESTFIKQTREVYFHLKEHNFHDSQIQLLEDSNQIHHENAWSLYFPLAISFWLD